MTRILATLRHGLAGFPKIALATIAIFGFLGMFAPWIAPHDPLAQNLLAANQSPDGLHWLGTDHLGRDTLSRIILGARTSMVAMVLIIGSAMAIGIGMGTVAGYRRGWTEEVIMRFIDVGLALPSLIIALAIMGIFGTGYTNMIIALTLAFFPAFARVSRGVSVGIMSRPHIEALRVMGASPARIYFRHLLPTTIGAVLVYATADAGGIALSIARLSFLGLGVQPPTPEWGQMLVDGMSQLESSPRQVLVPGLALTAVVVGFNLLGESIALNRIPRPLSARMVRRRRKQAAALAAPATPAAPEGAA